MLLVDSAENERENVIAQDSVAPLSTPSVPRGVRLTSPQEPN